MDVLKKIAVLFFFSLGILFLSSCSFDSSHSEPFENKIVQKLLSYRTIPLLSEHGLQFKDLNKNGRLDIYEDWRLTSEQRVADLVAKMTLAEKAGAMMHANPPADALSGVPGSGSQWNLDTFRELLLTKHITFFLNRLKTSTRDLAEQHNRVQQMAEEGRLGIPVSLSSDPRNQFRSSQGVSTGVGDFTPWPDPIGFAAMDDPQLVQAYADSVRQEYLAVGIRIALSPQADVMVNPRWHRANGTFGTDPEKINRLVTGYVTGMQDGSNGLHESSVLSVVKHWVGYGATGPEGFDAHNHYGRQLYFTADEIEQHIIPFTGAFSANVGAIMSSYGLPPENIVIKGVSEPVEHVGMGFNRQILQALLRDRFGFEGAVISDWHITDDCSSGCLNGVREGETPGVHDIGMPWGVEDLSKPLRFAKAISAGIDQFGGVDTPEIIVSLVEDGTVDIEAVDLAVKRILIQKFQQGLFENPYVDVDKAIDIVGNSHFKSMSQEAQQRSLILIKNEASCLPLSVEKTANVYLYHVEPSILQERGFNVVDSPDEADFAIVALSTPFEKLHPNFFLVGVTAKAQRALKTVMQTSKPLK